MSKSPSAKFAGLFDLPAEEPEPCIHPGLFSDDRGLAVLRGPCCVCGSYVPNREL